MTVGVTTTVKAVAFKDTWDSSTVATATYTMNFGTLAAPTASPAGGSFEGSVTVTLTGPADATIRYTTNGSEPTTSSTAYTAPIAIGSTTTLKAKAFHPNYGASATLTQVYTITVAAPTLTRQSGPYAPGEVVTIDHPDPAATIRLTLTGADPTSTDASVTPGTVLLIGGFTLKVRATKTGSTDSPVVSATYTLTEPYGEGALAAGSSHTVVSSPGGLLYAWGQNFFGQLGNGATTNRTTPTLIQTLTGVVALAGGDQHSLAVTHDGRLFAWGANGSGRLGDGTTTTRTRPVHIASLTGVVRVAAGASHSLALRASGQVYAWGDGASGQLGLGSTTSQSVPTPIPTLTDVVAIAAGSAHSLAVTSSGALYVWGANNSGQIGDGTTTMRTTPTLITALANVQQVAAGDFHSVARVQSGAVFAWGMGANGQLGLGTTVNQSIPTQVQGFEAIDVFARMRNSGAIASDGRVLMWGSNQSGQIGDGTTTTRTSPTAISASVVPALAAAGSNHAALVTPDGRVWTWGANADGQLGDGSTTGRPTPSEVFILNGAWGAGPPPTLSLAPGTYNTSQTVTVSSSIQNAVIRYTTNGAVPVETDPIVAVGCQVAIDATLTLRVRSWAPGLPPSPIVTAAYVLKPVLPTVTPASGTFTSAQTVTLSTSTSGTTLRYTLDGSDPTESSTEYSGPFSLATSATLKVRAFRSGWTASDAATSTFTFQYGALSSLVIDPLPGTYPPEQTFVLMSPDAGVTIRYTLDGSDPTAASTVYAGPISLVTGTTTLKAQAFKPDWTPSPILSATYTITTDFTPPTITATVSHSPNGAGWHTSDVTVTFTCSDVGSGILSCSEPVVVDRDGIEMNITGRAIDVAGNVATTAVTLNVDVFQPVLTIHTPAAGDNVPEDSTAIVRGTAVDFASGIASVNCNGVAATVEEQTYTCEVGVSSGSNNVLVTAVDRVGHTKTKNVSFIVGEPPTSALSITPAKTTVRVGEERELRLLNQSGRLITEATWNVDEPLTIELVTEGDKKIVRALSAGEATVTVTRNGITAQATVTVLAEGATLADGTVLWELGGMLAGDVPSRGRVMRAVQGAPLGPDGEQAALFFVDEGSLWSAGELYRPFEAPTRIRGVTIDGRQLWEHSFTGGVVKHVAADNHGGLLIVVHSKYNGADPLPQRIRRISGVTGTVTWEYLSADGNLSDVAVHPDGRVFVTDEPYYDYRINLVALEGASGAVLNRWTMPLGSFKRYANGQLELDGYPTPHATGPIIREDGTVVLVAHRTFGEAWIRASGEPGNVQVGPDPNHQGSSRSEVSVVTLGATGSSLTFQNVTLPPEENDEAIELDLKFFSVMPDGSGGYLLAHKEMPVVRRIAPSGTLTPLAQLNAPGTFTAMFETEYLLGEDRAYAFVKGSTNSGLKTQAVPFDPVTLAAEPTGTTSAGAPYLWMTHATQGGGVVVTGALYGHSGEAWTGLTAGWWENGPTLELSDVSRVAATAWPYAQGTAAGTNAQPPQYRTADEAAIAVLKEFNPLSILRNREYGGRVCSTSNGRFIWSYPNVEAIFSDTVQPSNCPAGLPWVGQYHTHGRDGGDQFSGPDIINADNNPGKLWYVATPCGNIDKYVGPNYAVYLRLSEKTETTIKCTQ